MILADGLLVAAPMEVIANASIGPVVGLPGQTAAYKANVSTGFTNFELYTRTQFVFLGDGARCHEWIISGVQDQGRSLDVLEEGPAAGAPIVIIDTIK